MTAEELLATIERQEAPVVVDVRSRAEYVAGHVPGAIHAPYWQLLFAGPAGVERHSRLVLYCGLGPRASMAALGLRWRGFAQLEELEGHWTEWQRLSLPQKTGGRP
jgi:rhodanese-related sulfurtransferase